MSLAELFYRREAARHRGTRRNTGPRASQTGQCVLEPLEPRLLLSATPTEALAQQALEPAAVTVPAGSLPSLDIDLNGQADALSDGIVIIRHLFGFTGGALTDGAIDPNGQRTDPAAIQSYLNSITSALDVDLNQSADALSDGIVIIRSLFGFTGAALTEGAIDPDGGATDPAVIAAYLDNMNPQRELLAPVVTAGLQQDTGISAVDAITNNATITGTIADISQITSFTAGFDATPVGSFVDVLADLQTTGTFTLSTIRLNQIAGGLLSDGLHTLHLQITDARGNLTTLDRTLTLDTAAPATPTFDLALTSDTGAIGDQETTAAIVTLKGQSDPTTSIQLLGPGIGTLSNGLGAFQVPDIGLAVGANAFTLRASDVAGNQSEFLRTITRVAAAPQADVVLDWNQTLLEAIRLDATPPPMASRGMAMVSLAMYDVINAIEGAPAYYVALTAQPGTSPDAAAAAAAHRVLSYLYPGQQALFDTALAASLSGVPDGAGETQGVALGQAVADAIIAIRATDGWNDFVDYVPGTQPGDWQPTAPMYDVALLPQWADLTPFALTSPNQFQPAGPPALTSTAYATALNEVKGLGSATGSTRTADQTEIARFWADGSGTYTPPGHWNAIASEIALQQGNSLSTNARLFAQLNVALADAAITAWDTKYEYEFWRPVTAIQQADLDGNAATTADPNWTSFLITPPFPEYTSGHSTFSGAAAEILTSVFGTNVGFSTTSLGFPGVTRNFTSFEQAAQEAGKSRIYGGIHFEFSNQDGLTSGKALADFVLNRFTVTADTQGPTILLHQQANTVTKTNLTLTGQVLDNLSGVAALQAKLDTGAFAPVTLSATGTFSLPTTLALDGTADGVHTLTFQATDHQNNLSTVLFTFTLDTTAPTITLTAPIAGEALTVASRLNGTVSGTGSPITKLTYAFDGGTAMPMFIDPISGVIDEPLDLSKLAVGNHTLTVTAMDAAGNTGTTDVAVSLAALIPFTVSTVTPQPGASDVGTTFRPQVFFSRAFNKATLNTSNFYATDSTGTKLSATIVPSQDGTFAWLFINNPMPGGEMITIRVDGTTILGAADGQALDANGDGTPGGVFTSTFSTVSLIPIPGTTITGRVVDPGPDLKPMTFDDVRAGADGALHTGDDVFVAPIANVKVFIVGLESQAVFTDAQGNFTLTDVPAGNVKVAVDGRTATNAPTGVFFPEMVMDVMIEPGLPNTMMGSMGTAAEQRANETRGEVYLPRLQTTILQTIGNTGASVVGVSAHSAPDLTMQEAQNLFLTVPPNTAVDANGQPIANVQIGISTVPPELVRDMLPAGIMQLSNTITIQARGPNGEVVDRFVDPIQLTFPNVYGAAPGTKLAYYSFDHTTGRLVIEGTATVSADGLSATTDPGQGITKPGWHGLDAIAAFFKDYVKTLGCDNLTDSASRAGARSIAAGIDAAATAISFAGFVDVEPTSSAAISGVRAALKAGSKTLKTVAPDMLGILKPDLDESPYVEPKTILDVLISLKSAQESLAGNIGVATFLDGIALFSDAIDLGESLVDAVVSLGDLSLNLGACLAEVVLSAESLLEVAAANSPIAELEALRVRLSAAVNSFNTKFKIGVEEGINSLFRIGVILEAANGIAITDPAIAGELRQLVARYENALNTFNATGHSTFLDWVKGDLDEIVRVEQAVLGILKPHLMPAGPVYYSINAGGAPIYGKTSASGLNDVLLPQNRLVTITYFDPATGSSWHSLVTTPRSGVTLTNITVSHDGEGTDTDGDGLADAAETALGTNARVVDSDGDGIADLAEIRAGTDPLGGRALPTGVVGSLALQGEAKGIAIAGSVASGEAQTAYIATGSYGLAIVDASQFRAPVVLAQLDLAGDAVDVSVDSSLGLAAVASGIGGLHVVDVNTASAPALLRTLPINAGQVEVFEGVVYVGVGAEVQAYDLVTGEKLAALAVSSTVTGLARDGRMLYAMESNRTLRAIDISKGLLEGRGTVLMPTFGNKLFVGNGIAYVAAGNGGIGGFMAANVGNPDLLQLLSGIDNNGVAGTAIALNGSGLAVVAGHSVFAVGGFRSVDVMNVSNPADTGNFVTRLTLPQIPFDVAIGGGIAFVADGTGDLQVVNYLPFDNQSVAPVVTAALDATDIDPVTAGIQLQEGTFVNLRPTVTDDVQVRNVELLQNGQAVRNDVAFPFELSTVLPTIAANGSDQVILQVRATDTGGNFGLSAPITVQLVPDLFGPTVVSNNVTEGSVFGRSFRSVTLTFSEAIDQASFGQTAVQLIDGNSSAINPGNIQFRRDGKQVQLTFAEQVPGAYTLRINQAQVKDLAGNAMGVTSLDTHFTIKQFSVEWINPAGGNWATAANWSAGIVPIATDDVFIPVTSSPVVISSGTVTIQTLISNGPLTLSGGTLTLNGDSQINGVFTQSGFSTVTGPGKLILAGPFALVAGTMIGTGQTILQGIGTISSLQLDDDRLVEIQGTTTWTGNTSQRIYFNRFNATGNGGTIATTATGVFDIQADAVMDFWTGTAGQFMNAGTIRKTAGTGTTGLDVLVSNNGAVSVETGQLRFGGGSMDTGSFGTTGSAVLEFGRGVHNLQAASSVAGNVLFTGFSQNGVTDVITVGGAYAAANTTVGLNSEVVFNSTGTTGTLTLTGGGILEGAGTLTVTGTHTLTSGTMRGTGQSILQGNGTISSLNLDDDRVVQIAGTTTWVGTTADRIWFNRFTGTGGAGRLETTATGIFDIQADAIMDEFNATVAGQFLNAGIIRKTAGTGTAGMDMQLVNSGTVSVQSGQLRFGGGSMDTGSFGTTGSAVLEFGRGVHNLQAASSITGNVLFTGFSQNGVADVITVGGAYAAANTTVGLNSEVVFTSTGTTGTLTVISNGWLRGSGTLTVTGTHTLTSGSMSGTGQTILQGTGTVSSLNLDEDRLVQIQGTTNWTGTTSDRIWFNRLNGAGNGGTIATTATGVFDVKADALMDFWTGAAGQFNNAGTIRKTAGAGTAGMDVQVNNAGTVAVQSGTLRFGGGGTHTGIFSVDDPAVLQFSAGTHNVNAGSISGTGLVSLTGATFNVNTPLSLQKLSLSGGMLGGAEVLTLTGTGSQWTGGLMAGGGTTVITAEADLTIGSGNRKFWGTRTIQNEGLLIEGPTSGDIVDFEGAAVLNNVGVFDIQNSRTWQHFAGAAGTLTINNSGTLKKSAGTGTFTFGQTTLHNTGTVDAQVGRLALGGGTSTGNFHTETNASIAFIAGTETWQAGTTVTGTGAIVVTFTTAALAGTLEVAGNISAPRVDVENLATLTGTGTLTLTGTGNQWTGGLMAGGGTTVIAAGADLMIGSSNRKFWGTRTIQNEGLLIEGPTSGDIVDFEGAAVLNNVGVFDIQNSRAWQHFAGAAGTLTINNSGTLKKSAGTGTFTFGQTTLHNTGTVDAQVGRLALGGGTSTGNFHTETNASIAFIAGTETWQAGTTVTGTGAIVVTFTTAALAGTLEVAGNISAPRVDVENLATLTGTGTLTLTGTGNQWTGGLMAGGGTTVIAAEADLTIGSGNRKFWGARTIQNEGLLIEGPTSGDIVDFEGTSVLNNVGIFDIQSNRAWQHFAGAAGSLTLNNSGTLRKTAGTGTFTFINTTIVNTGTIDDQIGTLAISGPLSNSGTISIKPGALIAVTGNYSQSSTGSLGVSIGGTATTQFGRITVTGSATLDGTLNVALANGFTPTIGNRFKFMTHASRTGFFAATNGLDIGGGLAFQVETSDPLDLELVTVAAAPASAAPDFSLDGSLAYVQKAWVQDFVGDGVSLAEEDEEELLIVIA